MKSVLFYSYYLWASSVEWLGYRTHDSEVSGSFSSTKTVRLFKSFPILRWLKNHNLSYSEKLATCLDTNEVSATERVSSTSGRSKLAQIQKINPWMTTAFVVRFLDVGGIHHQFQQMFPLTMVPHPADSGGVRSPGSA